MYKKYIKINIIKQILETKVYTKHFFLTKQVLTHYTLAKFHIFYMFYFVVILTIVTLFCLYY